MLSVAWNCISCKSGCTSFESQFLSSELTSEFGSLIKTIVHVKVSQFNWYLFVNITWLMFNTFNSLTRSICCLFASMCFSAYAYATEFGKIISSARRSYLQLFTSANYEKFGSQNHSSVPNNLTNKYIPNYQSW